MLTLESIKSRVRLILDDAEGVRFSDALLESAIRQALARLDEKQPLIRTLDQQMTASGRDVTLTGLMDALFILEVCIQSASPIEIKSGYSYTLQGETAQLHFSDTYVPGAGDILQVTYAAQNRLYGLDNATETTAPESASAALETGAASFACLLRAVSLSEAYGARAGESTRLVEQSSMWRELSEESMNKLKTFQEFDYPSGFALDDWDR